LPRTERKYTADLCFNFCRFAWAVNRDERVWTTRSRTRKESGNFTSAGRKRGGRKLLPSVASAATIPTTARAILFCSATDKDLFELQNGTKIFFCELFNKREHESFDFLLCKKIVLCE
jgi:hypothetical protein